ncbi:MAG: carbamate kinase [Bacillota bacterium]
MSKTLVIALGGNAILQPKQKGTYVEQLANVENSCVQIAQLVSRGYRLVLTHGNGPQVGNILAQNIMAQDKIPPMPLSVCGAMSQGFIGYMLQQSLRNQLEKVGYPRPVVTVLTQVRVAPEDPAFVNPTKPIGAFFSREEAARFMQEGTEKWVEDSGRGWRKVVASPKPVAIVEIDVIRKLVDNGCIVVALGGGGIPVVRKADGALGGTDAVIDKDVAAGVLAREINADMLMILTDVEKVAINYGTPQQQNLDQLTVAQANQFLDEGQFGSGSMAPKVRAAADFVEKGGRAAVIASLNQVLPALEGAAGTRVVMSSTISSVA